MKKIFNLQNILTLGLISFILYQFYISTLDGSGYITTGERQLFQNQYDDALESFALALQEITDSNKALFFSKGLTIEKTQNRLKALHGIGSAYAGLGRYEDAKDYLSRVLDVNPYYTVSKLKRASVLYNLRDYKGAVSDYTDILKTAPKAIHTYYLRGNANYKLKNYAGAVEDYSRAVSLSMDNPRKHEGLYYKNSLAWLLATCPQKEYRNGQKAVSLAEDIISIAETSFDKASGSRTLGFFKDTLAAAYAEAGRFKEAVETMEQALDLLETSSANDKDVSEFQSHLELFKSGKKLISR